MDIFYFVPPQSLECVPSPSHTDIQTTEQTKYKVHFFYKHVQFKFNTTCYAEQSISSLKQFIVEALFSREWETGM